MAKSRAKKTKAGSATLVAAAETAGRSLGRAVGVVERAIGRVRARKSSAAAPKAKTATGGKRR